MSENPTTQTIEDDGRTDVDAVQEMYTQAVNTNTLDEQKDMLAEMAVEAGTTLEALAAARKSRTEEAARRLTSSAANHYLKNEANADSWVRTKSHEE